jgi:predicted RecA/RadA family phage recombinase
MAQPTADIARIWKGDRILNNLTTAGVVYYGVACSDASGGGTINQLVDGENFVGFSLQQAASGETCQLAAQGIVRLTVTGVDAATDFGVPVYATEGNTFSLTDSGSDTVIGTVLRVHSTSANTADVFFQADSLRPE